MLPVFAYGAELAEWEDALDHWSAASFGYGADLTLLGATWANVMQTRKGSGALHWETEQHEARWRRVLGGCAAAGRCALRTVTEHLRQTAEAPYADFERRVRPLAAEAGVALLSQFAATWSGARLGVLRHHDTTRIHFSDAGRRFLAQLALWRERQREREVLDRFLASLPQVRNLRNLPWTPSTM